MQESNSKDTTITPTTFDATLALVRMLRTAEFLNLADSTQDSIKREILSSLFGSAASTPPMIEAQALQEGGEENEPPKIETPRDIALFDAEEKIKSLISSDAPWDEMEEPWKKMLRLKPKGGIAAKMLECVVLSGSPQSWKSTFEFITQTIKDVFLDKIHPAVRVKLLLSFWQKKEIEFCSYLFPFLQENWLSSQERLGVFLWLFEKERYKEALFLFIHFQKPLTKGVAYIGETLKVTLESLYLKGAICALKMGSFEEASNLVKKIPPHTLEYNQGIKLLSQIQTGDILANCRMGIALQKSQAWEERLILFRQFLEEIDRKKDAPIDHERILLNALLEEPLKYFPKSPDAWFECAQLLFNFRYLELLLPNVLQIFRNNTFQHHDSSLEIALWEVWVQGGENLSASPYFAIAQFHLFLSGADGFEYAIWNSRKWFQEKKDSIQDNINWEKIRLWGISCVESSKHVLEYQRKPLLAHLRVATSDQNRTLKDIAEFLDFHKRAPYKILKELKQHAEYKQTKDLEMTIIRKMGDMSHLRNSDLLRLWNLSSEKEEFDLSWRCATILRARQSLPTSILHAWTVSGENRSLYSFNHPVGKQLDYCFLSFAPEEARLIWALLHVGTAITELIASEDASLKPMKELPFKNGSFETQIFDFLKSSSWFDSGRPNFVQQTGSSFALEAPAFAETIPANEWSILASLITFRLGINTWHWRLSHLKDMIKRLLPKIATRKEFQKNSTEVNRWVRSLSSDQRTAWHDLSQLVGKISDEKGFRILSAFICRLTTCIYQNHYQALVSLQEMQAPIFLIWDLENWIVTKQYSLYREALKTNHTIPVPKSLQSHT